MRILVIDDSAVHQASARQTLKDHDLTVATSYEQGFRMLAPVDDEGGTVWKDKAGKRFDVVLSDLLMPAPGTMLMPAAKKTFEGTEQPLGWALVLRAILNGTRYAAIVSQTSHHDHPAAYALDAIDNAHDAWGDNKWARGLPFKKPQFVINGAVVGFFHSPSCIVHGIRGCSWKCDDGKDSRGKPCEMCEGTGFARGKNWRLVLKSLLEPSNARA